MQLRGIIPCLLFLAALQLQVGSAHAFSDQWQLAAGLGVGRGGEAQAWVPATSLDGAYGLSSSFDLEAGALFLGLGGLGPAESPTASVFSAGGAFKLDIIEWVPRLSLRAGYYLPWQASSTTTPEPEAGFALSLAPGLDYAWSREWGLGASLRFDSVLSEGIVPNWVEFMVSLQHRWGW